MTTAHVLDNLCRNWLRKQEKRNTFIKAEITIAERSLFTDSFIL